MTEARSSLPIDELLPRITAAVRANPIVLLEAEPGAGKTTRVPAALVAAGLREVLVLEPRRLAARMAARRVAAECGEAVGESAGYQVRFEQVGSAQTPLWFLTEGVLIRRLQSDPALRRTKVVVLDEFHERHLEGDLALALLRRLQRTRPDLRLLLMSATLGTSHLAQALGTEAVIQAPGRVHPVSIRYAPESSAPLEARAAAAVGESLANDRGHILVFLPGMAEIRRTLNACEVAARRHGAQLMSLHGENTAEEQDAAVAPTAVRKVICATNIAETSITIEGVRTVIDSGLARVLNHSPWSGLSTLDVEKVSKASAVQRAGRAGRTAPGRALRLFSESDFERRPENMRPELLRADLAQLTLQIASFGLRPTDLLWLDPPPEMMLNQAEELLQRLGLLRSDGGLTALGEQSSRLPVHPRLARFLLSAAERGGAKEAARAAAQLSEGRLRAEGVSGLDTLLQAELSYRASRLQKQLQDALPRGRSQDPQALEKAILLAFPDRVARRRGRTLLLSSGATLNAEGAFLSTAEFWVPLEVNAQQVRAAVPIEPDWILEFFPDRVTTGEELLWNRDGERVELVSALRYESLVLDESRSSPDESADAQELLLAKAIEAGWERFAEAEEVHGLLRRISFAGSYAALPAPADLLEQAMRQLTAGLSSFDELRRCAGNGGLLSAIESQLPMRLLNEIAPAHVTLPSGRRARIEYHDGRTPSVASRLQDFFGMQTTPAVARGAVPLVVELLAPNRRPVQVTTDLQSFWKNLYPQVRRELSRRYPRHSWPESPP